jgi:hypothetical protein
MCDHSPKERQQSPEETYRPATEEEMAKKAAEAEMTKKTDYAVSVRGKKRFPFMGELEELFRLPSPDPRCCRTI